MSPLLTREEAWERIAALAVALTPERVPLREAVGRVAARDVEAAIDLPPFDRSAMDGYALRAGDTPGTLPVEGEVAAGDAGGRPLASGATQRIFTGGAIPPGADTVERQEVVEARDGSARFAAVAPGQHIRRRGEDLTAGTVLLEAGAAVTVQSLSAVASAGVADIAVHRRARVAVLTTGDELVAPGLPLPPGAIYESTGVTLEALIARTGAIPIVLDRVRDDRAATRAAIAAALEEADVLLVAGGVSVGEHDHVRPALAEAGVEELFWGVKVKPGKPLFCGRRGDVWAFGLPGNPLSGFVSYLAFVEPLLRRLHGEAAAVERHETLRTTAAVAPADNRTTYLTARRSGDEVTATAAQGSAMTLALARADGFIVCDRPHAAGEPVRFLAV